MKENKEALIKYFEDLYNTEKSARDLYDEFLKFSQDKKINKKIEGIKKDEERHMKIAREIIDIIKAD